MRISDWSSDVGSSDLGEAQQDGGRQPEHGLAAVVLAQRVVGDGERDAGRQQQRGVDGGQPERADGREVLDDAGRAEGGPHFLDVEIARASWREGGGQAVYISEVAGSLPNNKHK